jgi:hypothetical protein
MLLPLEGFPLAGEQSILQQTIGITIPIGYAVVQVQVHPIPMGDKAASGGWPYSGVSLSITKMLEAKRLPLKNNAGQSTLRIQWLDCSLVNPTHAHSHTPSRPSAG